MRFIKLLPLVVGLTLIGVLTFAATAHAQNVAVPADGSVLDLLKPVYNAFSGGQYAYCGALLLVVIVALVKRYFGTTTPWLHTDIGGASMVLLASAGTAAATGLATPGAHLTFGLLKSSLLLGVTAAGGFSMIKSLVIEPLLIPLEAKAPLWMKPIFSLVLWIFDKPDAIKTAEAAGEAALVAKPPTGIVDVTGTLPTDVK